MPEMSSARVYIGHLPYNARESDVEGFFSRYGRIREILMKSGFGFVEFDDPRDAEEAVHRCNGKELRGERVIVEMTKRPPKGRDVYRSGGGRFGGGGDRGYGGRPNYYRSPPRRRDNEHTPYQTKYRVIVENLSSRVSWQDLKDVMRAAGEVTYADAHRIRLNEGIVCFSSAADLKKAMDTLDGKDLNGRKIKLIDASRTARRSRSRSGSKSRSGSRSRSRSSHRSRSGSASSKSKSRSRSRSSAKSRSKSDSRSRSGTPKVKKSVGKDKLENNRGADKRSRSKSKEKSHSRSASPDEKRRSVSGSASPDENGR